MGSLLFMIEYKMCLGFVENQMMTRISSNLYSESLLKEGCNEINFRGKGMRGFVFLDPEAINMDVNLEYWLQVCLDFNPFSKKSKKK